MMKSSLNVRCVGSRNLTPGTLLKSQPLICSFNLAKLRSASIFSWLGGTAFQRHGPSHESEWIMLIITGLMLYTTSRGCAMPSLAGPAACAGAPAASGAAGARPRMPIEQLSPSRAQAGAESRVVSLAGSL